jgi:putative ubiquitin-RnfH superfamily antitoxin RatB of RatAB toxin-antitoxin module
MRVMVALALPRVQQVLELDLPEGSRVADALAAARVGERAPRLEASGTQVGIWGKPCTPQALLRDGDRVEVYRPLEADAKAMRRARARLKTASSRSRSGP